MEKASKFSGAITNGSGEVSDSNSTILQFFLTNPMHEEGPVNASKFKGVVSQQNGNWGAQIYANHQRIWLGTFKSEMEAAMAYDSAAIKLRNGDAHRNFPWSDITIQEPKFQSKLKTDVVLAMIKDGSYEAHFSDYLKAQVQESYHSVIMEGSGNGKLTQLFQKELTPSDVSKLNRLVIPKKYAVKYFLAIPDSNENGGDNVDDVELEFFDWTIDPSMRKSWKFRYCYWKSSQSFVFTRGWNRFVKDKKLKAKDRVIFSYYEGCDCSGVEQRMFIIDVACSDGRMVGPVLEGGLDDGAREIMAGHHHFEDRGREIEKMDFAYEFEKVEKGNNENEKGNMGNVSGEAEKNGFRLFGVQIC